MVKMANDWKARALAAEAKLLTQGTELEHQLLLSLDELANGINVPTMTVYISNTMQAVPIFHITKITDMIRERFKEKHDFKLVDELLAEIKKLKDSFNMRNLDL
jgi:hypothetical protein